MPITTQRKHQKTAHEGHLYVFDKNIAHETLKSWRCAYVECTTNQKQIRCKARIHTNATTGEIVHSFGMHLDAANPVRIEVAAAMTHVKRRAEETQETPAQVSNLVSQTLSLAAQGEFPKRDTVRKVIQRVRAAIDAPPVQPADRASIVLPESYRQYESSPGNYENFLIADSGVGDDNRILIFGRETVGQWIGRVEKIYVDGTFSLAPALFSQLFVILAERGGFVLPVLYCLLPDKQEITYNRMLELILETWPSMQPTMISMDFERALINAFSGAFPNAELNGCLFHLSKNIRRRIAERGLTTRCNNDPDFSLFARMIPTIAFVPPDHLANAVEVLREELPDELEPIIDYLEDSYIGRPTTRGRRRQPNFSPAIWSVYERTLQGEPRTNNAAEAAHRRLQSEFGMDHPTLWRFIDGIRGSHKSRDLLYEQYVLGREPATKRARYIEADKRIKAIVETFEDREMIEYLRGIAQNILLP